ncbi:serine-rich adhesin for platelets-like isoform X2 [Argopecten irradians]|uniref:serine-rich adhesin for platelets-like isoform X2 n=1 Tax=Argopecten irradians TaxID=31199 RepID=UPI003710C0E4
MMKATTRSNTKTPKANKSQLPVPKKARPAPNFAKLHKDWQDRFETGKMSAKKPCTKVREFEVTRPGTKFMHDDGDSDGESLPDFEADQLALESILNERGVGQNRITGRATISTDKPSSNKMKRSRSAHSLGKRRVFGELACDPEQKRNGRRRSRSAKKALEFTKEIQKATVTDEFEHDVQAMESILNETGVTGSEDQGRFTYAGPGQGISQTRQSIYYVPQKDRTSMAKAVTDYHNLLLSKLDPKNAKLQLPAGETVLNVLDKYNASQQMSKIVESPFGRTITTPIRHSIYKSYQIQSHLRNPNPGAVTAEKEEMAHVNSCTPKRVLKRETSGSTTRRVPYSCKSSSKKNVKWADVLKEEDSCDAPVAFKKEKVSKKSLFQPLSVNETCVDNYKENSAPGVGEVRPGGRGHRDRRDNTDDATTAFQHYSGTAAGDESSAATESFPSSVAELGKLSMSHPARLHTSQATTAPRTRHPTLAWSTEHGDTSPAPPPCHAQITTPGTTQIQDFYPPNTNGTHVKGLVNVPSAVPCGAINPHPGTTTRRNDGTSTANTNSHGLQAIGEQEILLDNKIRQRAMAMHTDEVEDGQTPQQGTASDHVTTDTHDRVNRFVGQVKRTQKRQSIAELNESISESHVHLQRLAGEITRLQSDNKGEISELNSNQGNTQTETTNIIYHLEMIRKQQEQLMLLEQQLQEQLTVQAQGQGHYVGQGQTDSECDSLNGNMASGHDTVMYSGVDSGVDNNNVITADGPASVTSSQNTDRNCDTTIQPSGQAALNMWTPHQALPSQTKMTTVSVCVTTPSVRECEVETPCPIDLSNKSPATARSAVNDLPNQTLNNSLTCQSPYRKTFCPTTPSIGNTNSAFTSVPGSPLGLGSPFRSLSLKASVMASPARSSPLRMVRREEESLLRMVSVRTNERYLEALLDEECALYAYRLQTLRTEEDTRMDITNPVARVLSEGDDMHFVPIMEEGPHAIGVRENSAFCCYAR